MDSAKYFGWRKQKGFRRWQPEQTSLRPPCPGDWISEHHQLNGLLDRVDERDLGRVLSR